MKKTFWTIVGFGIIGCFLLAAVVWSLRTDQDRLARHVPSDAGFYLRWRLIPDMDSSVDLDRWMEDQLMVAKDWTTLKTWSDDLALAAWRVNGQPVRLFLARGSRELSALTHVLATDDVRITWEDGVVGWVTPASAQHDIQALSKERSIASERSLDRTSWALRTSMASPTDVVLSGTEIFLSPTVQRWSFRAEEHEVIWSAAVDGSTSAVSDGAMARSMDELLEMVPASARVILHGWKPGAASLGVNTPSQSVNTPRLLADHISWSEQFHHPGTLALVSLQVSPEEENPTDALGMIWVSSEVKSENDWRATFEKEWAQLMAVKLPRRESVTLPDGSYRLDLYPSTHPVEGSSITVDDQTFYQTDRGAQPFLYGVQKSRLVVVTDQQLLALLPDEPEQSAARMTIFEQCQRTRDLPFLWMEHADGFKTLVVPPGFVSVSEILWESHSDGTVMKICGSLKK
jgi:hypothetical protein